MRLRTHLVVLVLAALVPVLLFAVLLVRENARLQLAATERGMRETAHAVASAVDKTLDGAITTLEALAESDYLDAPDLRAFHPLCQRITAAQGWKSILLFDAGGRTLMHTERGLGRSLPATRRPALVAQAVADRKPVISGLFDGEINPHIVAVYVPVVRDGTVRYVISAALGAADFSELLRAQAFGGGSVAVLQDADNVIVARSQRESEMVGQRVRNPTPGREGFGAAG